MGAKGRRVLIGLVLVAGILASAPRAWAWLRMQYPDAEVVERSNLIVIGHLKQGSVEYVDHNEGRPEVASSEEYHATLLVTEVLKGTFKEKQTLVVIDYGLTPVIGGFVHWRNSSQDWRGGRKEYPKDIIEILDTGNSARSDQPLVKDAGEDNIWLLRSVEVKYGKESGALAYHIADPEDLQPLVFKDYILAYLSKDPVAGVKAQLAKHPELKDRIEDYLDHVEIQRICTLADPKARAEALVPYYEKRLVWGSKGREATQALLACGDAVAGPCLIRLLKGTKPSALRNEIIWDMGQLKFPGCVDALVNLLKDIDASYARPQPKTESGRTDTDFAGETMWAVRALGRIGDPRAKEIIERTRQRCDLSGDRYLVETCDYALKDIANEAAKAPDDKSKGKAN